MTNNDISNISLEGLKALKEHLLATTSNLTLRAFIESSTPEELLEYYLRKVRNSELITEIEEKKRSQPRGKHTEEVSTAEKKVALARESFFEYVCLMAPELIPEGFILGRHIKLICDELEEVFWSIPKNNRDISKRKAKRLQLFLPPGGMKSLLASVLFPSWCFGKRATIRFIGVGNSTDFATANFGRPIRDIMETAEYAYIFPKTTVRMDVRSAAAWMTDQGGTYVAAGAGKAIAGRRAHICICDDVISEQTAYSPTERNAINRWYIPGLQSRLLKGGAEIIINTRWHTEDLSGARVKHDGGVYGIDERVDRKTLNKHKRPWKIVSIPAILDNHTAVMLNKACPNWEPLGAGDSYWPELWPLEEFEEKRNTGDMTKATWSALYMQSPTPEEGSIIKQKDIKIWDRDRETPTCEYVVASLDTAFSKSETADYSAFTVWGIFSTKETDFRGKEFKKYNALLLAARRGHWSFGELTEQVREVQKNFKPDIYVVEQKASGQSLIQEMQLQGFPVHPYLPDKDKLSRAHASTPLFENGSVWVPEGRDWADEVVDELTTFPFAPHDDYTDTVTQAMLWLRDSWFLKSEHNIYNEEDEDEGYYEKNSRSTYWSSISG